MKICLNLTYILYLVCSIQAQWQPDQRLTNNPGISYLSYNNAHPVVSKNDTIIVFFSDNRIMNNEIYCKWSYDGGNTWKNDQRLTFSPENSICPSSAIFGSYIHVVWYDWRDGNDEIYYKRTTNHGAGWDPDIRMTVAAGYSGTPSLSLNGPVLHLTWEDKRDGNSEIYYKRSTNNGSSWESEIRLTNSAGTSSAPSIAVSGQLVHISWYDNRDGNYEIYYMRSLDGGANWGPNVRLTNNVLRSELSCIAVSESDVHVVWYDNRHGNDEIYFKHSSNNGDEWSSDVRLTNASGTSRYPNIAASGLLLHLIWDDSREGPYSLYYKNSTDGGISWSADLKLTTGQVYNSHRPSLVINGESVCAVWEDFRNNNWEIYFKKNPVGNIIGIQNIGIETPKQFLLYQNYPNPFNPNTKIKFDINETAFTSLRIFDVLGSEIETLVDMKLKPGVYEVTWDGSNFQSGVYFYKLQSGIYSVTNKLILIK